MAIKAIRGRLGESQVVFCRRFFVSPTSVARWEQGVVLPSAGNLISLFRLAQTEQEIGPLLLALAAKHISISHLSHDIERGLQETYSIAEAAAAGQSLNTDSMGQA